MKKSKLQLKSLLNISSLVFSTCIIAHSNAYAYGFKEVELGTVANYDDMENRLGLKCESLEEYKSICFGETTILGSEAKAIVKMNNKNIVYYISVIFKPKFFDDIKSSLVKKYGKYNSLDFEKVSTQNGGKYTQVKTIWKSKGETIYLNKYAENITEGTMFILSDEYLKLIDKKIDQNEKDI